MEEIKYNKQERDRIKSEINDLESRIIVEGGRNNRYEVNNYRNRVNRLKMRLNEVSLRIAELEKLNQKSDSKGELQMIANRDLNVSPIKNGEITITDTIEFDRGFDDIPGDVVETVNRTVERTIIYKNGKPVSSKETLKETITTKRLRNADEIFIESSIVG